MHEQNWSRVKQVFGRALEAPLDARAQFLSEMCGDDDGLRATVVGLLEANDLAENLMESPTSVTAGWPAGLAASVGIRAELGPGEVFGGYTILRVLGRGGMGTVYAAEQKHPRRSVALKVIRPELATPETFRRFAREADLLGRLHHPGIAQIYEAGSVETVAGACPYFAMELVHGSPLGEHAAGLSIIERAVLAVKICQAVEYAHSQRMVHRDLKPANIMVDERGEPRILDFGIARLTGPDEGATLNTSAGQVLGTLTYMSPEQVAGNPAALTPASDVYSLGVILYELFAGAPPHDLTDRTIAEASRIIREEEPTRLGMVDGSLRGDLETIVSKAMEKEPERRYASAGALGDDLRRFLTDEPILARPPGTVYQLRKLARRNPGLVLGVAATMAALTLGIVLAGVATVYALREAGHAKAVTASMKRILISVESLASNEDEVSAVAMLHNAEEHGVEGLENAPDAEIELRTTLGRAYSRLGDAEAAHANYARAAQLSRGRFGVDSPGALECIGLMTESRVIVFNRDLPAPLEDAQAAAAALEVALRTLGRNHPTTLRLMNTCSQYAQWGRDFPRAAALLGELIPRLRAGRRESGLSLLSALARQAWALEVVGRGQEAAALRREAVELALSPRSDTAVDAAQGGRYWTAYLLYLRNEVVAAEPIARLAVDCAAGHLGLWSAHAVAARFQVLVILLQLGKDEERMQGLKDLSDHLRRAGSTDFDRVWYENGLAMALFALGRTREGCELGNQTFRLTRTQLGDDDPRTHAYWIDYALRCGLRSLETWASESIRLHVFLTMERVLGGLPRGLELADLGWDQLHFELERLNDAGLTPVTAGGNADLRAVAEPPPGLYRVAIVLPRRGARPIRAEAWIPMSPWTLQLFHGLGAEQIEPRLRAADEAGRLDQAEEERPASTIAFEGFMPRGFGPLRRPYNFGLLGETTVSLPRGRYRFFLEADDHACLRLDRHPLLEGWGAEPGSVRWADVSIEAGVHELQIAYEQLDRHSLLWLRIEPEGDWGRGEREPGRASE